MTAWAALVAVWAWAVAGAVVRAGVQVEMQMVAGGGRISIGDAGSSTNNSTGNVTNSGVGGSIGIDDTDSSAKNSMGGGAGSSSVCVNDSDCSVDDGAKGNVGGGTNGDMSGNAKGNMGSNAKGDMGSNADSDVGSSADIGTGSSSIVGAQTLC